MLLFCSEFLKLFIKGISVILGVIELYLFNYLLLYFYVKAISFVLVVTSISYFDLLENI